jgi:cytochrome o ubiquinol oxidase subunit 2
MRAKHKLVVTVVLSVVLAAAVGWWLQGQSIPVLQPQGQVADKQRNLMLFATLLSAVVVVPVFALTAWIVWRYREGAHKKARYTPDWDGHRGLELLWWLVPLGLITVLSVVTWHSSHDLDPYKPLVSSNKPVTVQVVALQWKWLFIYPEQDIATVNYVQFPEDTPVNFVITSDAPMNSFWIPNLGGQVYAMAGMSTKLHLMADKPGTYRGSSANLSGEGFANMHFLARSTTATDFDAWVEKVRMSPTALHSGEYRLLAEPSEELRETAYAPVETGLYDTIVMKYMEPGHEATPETLHTGGKRYGN